MKPVIIITGASSGLGKEVAKLLQQKQKYHLILCGRNAKGFTEFKNNPDISIVLGDITVNETLTLIVETVKQNGNRVDVLINNAGIIYLNPFEENTPEKLEKLLTIDLMAPMLLTQRLYPFMVTQQSGHIINVNSTAGKEGKPNHTMYCAAKWGLTGFTNALRLEAKHHGIKVTSFHPGGMNTAFYDEMTGVATEKFMDPQKIAAILLTIIETDPSISPDEIVLNRMTK